MNYGSYTLGAELGRGGMGVVHRAQHTVLGTPACVKLLLPEFTQNPDIVARFVNEARAAASLSHDNIVDVLDCNQASDGVWFIVLEYLDGVPLSKWMRGATGSHVAPRLEGGGVANAVAPAQIAPVRVAATRIPLHARAAARARALCVGSVSSLLEARERLNVRMKPADGDELPIDAEPLEGLGLPTPLGARTRS